LSDNTEASVMKLLGWGGINHYHTLITGQFVQCASWLTMWWIWSQENELVTCFVTQ